MRIATTADFEKAYRKEEKGRYIDKIDEAINCLAEGRQLPRRYQDHVLTGDLRGIRECHIRPDLLLLYIRGAGLITLVDLGSHSHLFG